MCYVWRLTAFDSETGFSSRDLDSVKYTFIVITSRSTLTRSGIIFMVPTIETERSILKLFAFDKTVRKKKKRKETFKEITISKT